MTKNNLKKLAFVMIIMMGIGLIALAVLVHFRSILGTDVFLSRDLQAEGDTPERRTIIYHILYAISLFGKPLIAFIMVGLFALLFLFYRYYRETVYVLTTPISALIGTIVKIIVGRTRPPANLVKILVTEADKSFPSGHVVFYTVFFGFLFVSMFFTSKIPLTLRRLIQAISIFLIISISFSRVYLGVHWVTDTIGGYLLGGIVLSVILYFYLRTKLRIASAESH